MKKHNFLLQITPDDTGQRIDKVLGSHADVGSRSKAEVLITQGLVLFNGKPVKSSHRVATADIYEVQLPEPEPVHLMPLNLKLDILHDDADVIVINKPAGLVVHPAAGHAQDTLVNALLNLQVGFNMQFGENRPGIVHRLDKDTSGLLVVAKNDKAQESLVQQFKSRRVHRRYQALICSRGLSEAGSIQSYLARHPKDRKRFASLKDDHGKILRIEGMNPKIGKWAKTHYRICSRRSSGLALVIVKLETGRTHQIRIHLSESGAGILADPIYNRSPNFNGLSGAERSIVEALPRLALHAFELGFQHPTSGQHLSFLSDWPEDMRNTLMRLELWKDPHDL